MVEPIRVTCIPNRRFIQFLGCRSGERDCNLWCFQEGLYGYAGVFLLR